MASWDPYDYSAEPEGFYFPKKKEEEKPPASFEIVHHEEPF